MKELLEKALELAKAGYLDAAIDLIEKAIASLSNEIPFNE
jgi:hypothetical protein